MAVSYDFQTWHALNNVLIFFRNKVVVVSTNYLDSRGNPLCDDNLFYFLGFWPSNAWDSKLLPFCWILNKTLADMIKMITRSSASPTVAYVIKIYCNCDCRDTMSNFIIYMCHYSYPKMWSYIIKCWLAIPTCSQH